eukprot:CAMPEP_0117871424 /NCGR_PEP_ID=MMETSP0950-20121206/10497_1 /TAXON_ID=44440 /ORGANISM="Chattonella subsalsa, Strain CCMP2191" /LENGTH=183 /DNA_ID=CAMNT_0005724039 /DNA_START=156 /DNA_END=707 /DNA_ORIENTATION=-
MQYRLSQLALENRELRQAMREKEQVIEYLEKRLADCLLKFEEMNQEQCEGQKFFARQLEGKARRIQQLEVETARLSARGLTSTPTHPQQAWQTPVRAPKRESGYGAQTPNLDAPGGYRRTERWSTSSLPNPPSPHSSNNNNLKSELYLQAFKNRERINKREFIEAERRLQSAKLHATPSPQIR